jgi:hypothetical protein
VTTADHQSVSHVRSPSLSAVGPRLMQQQGATVFTGGVRRAAPHTAAVSLGTPRQLSNKSCGAPASADDGDVIIVSDDTLYHSSSVAHS